MGAVSSLADDASVRPLGAVRVHDDVRAIRLIVVLALLAGAAGEYLGPDTDSLAFLDQRHFGSNTNGSAHDLYVLVSICTLVTLSM